MLFNPQNALLVIYQFRKDYNILLTIMQVYFMSRNLKEIRSPIIRIAPRIKNKYEKLGMNNRHTVAPAGPIIKDKGPVLRKKAISSTSVSLIFLKK